MKKKMFSISALALLIAISSCTNDSMESDVRKMAQMMCKSQRLQVKAMQGDEKAQEELKDLNKEANEFGEKMKKKYEKQENNAEFEEKAEKILREEMEKCKDKE